MEEAGSQKFLARYGAAGLAAVSLLSFFSLYAWAFRYFLPFEVRVFVGSDFYAKLGLELVLALAVSSLFAKGVDFQIRSFLKNLIARNLTELRFERLRWLHQSLVRLDPDRVGRVTFFSVFVLAFVFYFSGLWISMLVLLMCYPLVDSLGFKAEAEMLAEGQDVPYTTAKFGIGLNYILGSLSFTRLVPNISSFALVFLEIAIAIGAGRFLQAAFGEDVSLLDPSETRSYKVITSSTDGVILMDSSDATLSNLLFSSEITYLVITASGERLLFKR